MSEFAELNDCKYLYLAEIAEPSDNALRLIVQEAKASGAPASDDIGGPFTAVRPIEHTPGCRVFEFLWETYIAYSVRNESYAMNANGDVFAGNLFRKYSKSSFQSYLSQSTFASPEHPGQYWHWGIVCLNHVVDVASTTEPKVTIRVAA